MSRIQAVFNRDETYQEAVEHHKQGYEDLIFISKLGKIHSSSGSMAVSLEEAEKIASQLTIMINNIKSLIDGESINLDRESARKTIETFVEQRGYTYSVDQLLDTYLENYKKGFYVSYTAKDCIKYLEKELEVLSMKQCI